MPQAAQKYWLIKSEPDVYSIDQLRKDGSTTWEGVRNFQARNFMRDEMKVGDLVLFYHSNADKAVVGVARIVKEAEVDPHQFNQKSKYFDPKSKPEKPQWLIVTLGFVAKLDTPVSLAAMKADPCFDGMAVTAKFSRLSVQPVSQEHFEHVLKLAGTSLKTVGA